MIAFLRSRRCRLPLAVILLLVTQIALAGQSCRAVMFDMYDGGTAAAQPLSNASDGAPAVHADALPCCGGHAPPPGKCLVPDDASTAAALVATGMLFPDLAPPAAFDASIDTSRVADGAPSPAGYPAGSPPRIYIVYHRFLS